MANGDGKTIEEELDLGSLTEDEREELMIKEFDELYGEKLEKAKVEVSKDAVGSIWDEVKDVAKKGLEEERKQMVQGKVYKQYMKDNGFLLDYQAFLGKLADIYGANRDKFDPRSTASELIDDLTTKIIKSRIVADGKMIVKQLRKTKFESYDELFKVRKKDKAAAMYMKAQLNELNGVPLEEVVDATFEIDEFGDHSLPVAYKEKMFDVESYVVLNLKSKKDLKWKKNWIRRGVKEGIEELIKGREWQLGYSSIKKKREQYEAEVKRLDNKWIKRRKRTEMLNNEIYHMKVLEDKFKDLNRYRGLDVPVNHINDQVTSVWLDQIKPDVKGLVDFISKELDEQGFNVKSDKVGIGLLYVPKVKESEDGKYKNHGIEETMCKLWVTGEIEYGNQRPRKHKGRVKDSVFDIDIPENLVPAVQYLALFERQFYEGGIDG